MRAGTEEKMKLCEITGAVESSTIRLNILSGRQVILPNCVLMTTDTTSPGGFVKTEVMDAEPNSRCGCDRTIELS